jgi:DNA-binding GntR family transcriptional regulator
MLQLYPKRGALVVAVSTAELREVLIARALIEPWAVGIITSLGDRANVVAQLLSLIGTAQATLEARDTVGFQEADRAFHQTLVSAAGNHLIAAFYSSLHDRQVRGGMLTMRSTQDRGAEILDQHAAIVDLLERGDGPLAAAMVVEHLNRTTELLGLAPLR